MRREGVGGNRGGRKVLPGISTFSVYHKASIIDLVIYQIKNIVTMKNESQGKGCLLRVQR